MMTNLEDELAEALALDHDLLAIRDRLELNRAAGDNRFNWLLTQTRKRINEQARKACHA